MATLRRLPWHPAHGVALASMLRQPPPPDHAGDTEHLRWECCPRSALQRVLRAARERHGVRFRVGFEVEFVLLRGRDPGQGDAAPRPIDAALYCQTSALDAAAPVLDDITDALAQLGIEVEQVHKEAAGGQFEIVTEHEDALKAVDNLLLTREAISCVAARAGLSASFLPKLGSSEPGSGAHCHISLFNVADMGPFPAGTNLVSELPTNGQADGAAGRTAAAFAAGVLRHLPALMAWTLPSAASYARLQPSTWSSCYQVWGVDNREAPVRLCASAGAGAQNWEFKALDATANPHLALAAVIAAGCDGLEHGWTLPEPCNIDPVDLPGAARLPKSLAEAIRTFEAASGASWAAYIARAAQLAPGVASDGGAGLHEVLKRDLGPALVTSFMAVRRAEEEHFRGSTPEALAEQLLTRY